MTDLLTVGGLFSGIGGLELGLERAGMEIAWHCEADPFCRRVLEKHWPRVPCFDDVCTLNAGMAEGVDVLCGGFPCQDISLSGKGAGIDGARSGLWSEFARLIGEFRPRYVVVENVSALLGRGLDRVLGDLAALGFDAEWDCIPASAVGAPHQRDRIWLVAYPSGARRRQDAKSAYGNEGADAWRSTSHDHDELGSIGSQWLSTVADTAHKRHERPRPARFRGTGLANGSSGELSDWWQVEPDMGRVADGVPARVDRLRSLGNALVPQIAEWIGRRIVEHEMGLEPH